MQASGSGGFSSARLGRPRPSNILSGRPESSEDRPWPSPSFPLGSSVGASTAESDPLRPSSAIKLRVPGSFDELPPTPITAGMKLAPEAQQQQLPPVRDIIMDSPPQSGRSVPADFAEASAAAVEQPIRKTTSEVPRTTSKTGIFRGPSADWANDLTTMLPPLVAPGAPRLGGRTPLPPISTVEGSATHLFENMPTSAHVAGLGLQLQPDVDATPRLGSFTPRQDAYAMSRGASSSSSSTGPLTPPAPHLSRASRGTFSPFVKAYHSPLSKPLGNEWNTDLHFDDSGYAPSPPSYAAVKATPMERERTVQMDRGMPRWGQLNGLGISFADEEMAEAESSRSGAVAVSNSLRNPMAIDEPLPTSRKSRTSPPKASSRSGSSSSGLTPHVQKTRLTPYIASTTRKNASTEGEDGEEVSPALRTKSKRRSELLQSHAAAAFSTLALDEASTATRGSSPLRASSKANVAVISAPVTATKKALSASQGASNPSSPWGVFNITTAATKGAEDWQPLGPPSSSRFSSSAGATPVLGESNRANAASTHDMTSVASKKVRKVSSGGSDSSSGSNASSAGSLKSLRGSLSKLGGPMSDSPTVASADVFGASTGGGAAPLRNTARSRSSRHTSPVRSTVIAGLR